MAQVRERFVQCATPAGLNRLAYREWGDLQAPVLVCVHGLTRCARDFDTLAAAMADRYRVVCPDVAGRGRSGWYADPMLYQVPQYVADMVTLIARLDVESVHWVGTSMGALIGMALASLPAAPGVPPLVSRLVMNDAGPVVTRASLERIAAYVGLPVALPDFEAALRYVRTVSASFGPHSEEQWRCLTEAVVRRNDDGSWRLHYDPRLAEPFRKTLPEGDLELWPLWNAIRCPTLVVRGAESDLLTRETAQKMTTTGPKAALVEFAGVGHAPTLMQADQVSAVRAFLLAG